MLGFTPHSDHKRKSDYISQNKISRITMNQGHLNCDCTDGSIVKSIREPVLSSFVLERPPDFYFCFN